METIWIQSRVPKKMQELLWCASDDCVLDSCPAVPSTDGAVVETSEVSNYKKHSRIAGTQSHHKEKKYDSTLRTSQP